MECRFLPHRKLTCDSGELFIYDFNSGVIASPPCPMGTLMILNCKMYLLKNYLMFYPSHKG